MSETVASAEDPRIGRTRRAVREATLQVLADQGWAAFTVEAVAAEARVAKSTIYRHWPGRLALVADALDGLNRQPGRAGPDGHRTTSHVRPAVERLLVHLAGAMADSLLSSCMPALVEAAAHEPEVAAFLHAFSADRRGTLVELLAAGVASGELPAHLDPDLASLALAGPIAYRRFLTPEPFPASQVPDLVDQVLGPRPADRSA